MYQSFCMALAGSMLVLGGVTHAFDVPGLRSVLEQQSAAGLTLARVAARYANLIGPVMTIAGGLSLLGAITSTVPTTLAVVPAGSLGVVFFLQGVHVLRAGLLACGCMGKNVEPMAPSALLPSAVVISSTALAFVLGQAQLAPSDGYERAAVVALGIQAAVVLGLMVLALGHTTQVLAGKNH